jgi:2-hydroxychromene-2-carboxylate isomerase
MDVRPIAVEWGLLSLEYINRNEPSHPMTARFRTNRWAMRLLSLARETGGNEALGRLYFSVGEAHHDDGEELSDGNMLADALGRSGLPADLLEQTRESVQLDRELWAGYESACATGAFGVPTLYFGDRDIPFYGPVIDRVPSGREAGDLWDHILGLSRHESFYEIKRPR